MYFAETCFTINSLGITHTHTTKVITTCIEGVCFVYPRGMFVYQKRYVCISEHIWYVKLKTREVCLHDSAFLRS